MIKTGLIFLFCLLIFQESFTSYAKIYQMSNGETNKYFYPEDHELYKEVKQILENKTNNKKKD